MKSQFEQHPHRRPPVIYKNYSESDALEEALLNEAEQADKARFLANLNVTKMPYPHDPHFRDYNRRLNEEAKLGPRKFAFVSL